MVQKVKTMPLSGNEYAKVAERLKIFREQCPNGLIDTSFVLGDDGSIVFTARILKNKADPSSGEATGHAMGDRKEKIKIFEKLESVAVGRALANLGYLASGEIASSDEMEAFYEFQQHKINEAVGQLSEAETIDDLKKIFLGLGSLMAEKAVIEAKDNMKIKLGKPDVNKEV